MNQKHLTQVWQWMSIACVLFLLTSIISIQGPISWASCSGTKVPRCPTISPRSVTSAPSWGGGLFLIASFVLLLHAYRHGNRWHNRVPVVWLEGLDTSIWDGKMF